MFWLFALAGAVCTHHVVADLGVMNHRFDLDDGDTVCVNVTAYPFSIVFGEFGDSTLYREYTHRPVSGAKMRSFEALLRFMPMHRTLIEPEHSITITAVDATRLSFTTAELPGMCGEGIYLSTVASNVLEFSPASSRSFFGLREFDDKCVVLGPYENASISVEVKSDDYEDQVFVHTMYTEYGSVSGNDTYSAEVSEPVFFRIVADNVNNSCYMKINVTSDLNARNPLIATFIPTRAPQACDETPVWYNERIAVTVAAVTACIGICFLVILCAVSIRQTMGTNPQNSSGNQLSYTMPSLLSGDGRIRPSASLLAYE